MLKVQHIGIPVTDLDKTITQYKAWGFDVIFRIVLDDGTNVAFINVSGVILEFYSDEVYLTDTPVIKCLIINHRGGDKHLVGPSGEEIIFVNSKTEGLNKIVLNTNSIEKTGADLNKHDFIKEEEQFSNGSVTFALNRVDNKPCIGAINHIAFDEAELLKRSFYIKEKALPIVEGINFLPFFDNGVIYFVTQNHNGLRLEYNQRL